MFAPEVLGPASLPATAAACRAWAGSRDARASAHPHSTAADVCRLLADMGRESTGPAPRDPLAAVAAALAAQAGHAPDHPLLRAATMPPPTEVPLPHRLHSLCVSGASGVAALWLRLARPRRLRRLALLAAPWPAEADACGTETATQLPQGLPACAPSDALALGGCCAGPRALRVLLCGPSPSPPSAHTVHLLNVPAAAVEGVRGYLGRGAGAAAFVVHSAPAVDDLPLWAPADPTAALWGSADVRVPQLGHTGLREASQQLVQAPSAQGAPHSAAHAPGSVPLSALWAEGRWEALSWHPSRQWWARPARGVDGQDTKGDLRVEPLPELLIQSQDDHAAHEGGSLPDTDVDPSVGALARLLRADCLQHASRLVLETVTTEADAQSPRVLRSALLSTPRRALDELVIRIDAEEDEEDEEEGVGESTAAFTGGVHAPCPTTLPALRRLCLACAWARDNDAGAIAAACPALEVLCLDTRRLTTHGLLAALAGPSRASAPEAGGASECPLRKAAAECPPRHKYLQALTLTGCERVAWLALAVAAAWTATAAEGGWRPLLAVRFARTKAQRQLRTALAAPANEGGDRHGTVAAAASYAAARLRSACAGRAEETGDEGGDSGLGTLFRELARDAGWLRVLEELGGSPTKYLAM